MLETGAYRIQDVHRHRTVEPIAHLPPVPRAAGFKLRHLEIMEHGLWAHKTAEYIRFLVEVLEVNFPRELQQKVSSTSITGPIICQPTPSGGVITRWAITIEPRASV